MYKYKKIRIGNKVIDEHRYIMEQFLGRKLKSNEIVHHIDGNKRNNNLSNLEILTRSEHARLHKPYKYFTELTKQKISNIKKNKTLKNSRKVKQLDVKTNKILNVFNSTIEASRFINKKNGDGHIRQCCNKVRKTAYSYKWEWL